MCVIALDDPKAIGRLLAILVLSLMNVVLPGFRARVA
jgi:hypothetical protein